MPPNATHCAIEPETAFDPEFHVEGGRRLSRAHAARRRVRRSPAGGPERVDRCTSKGAEPDHEIPERVQRLYEAALPGSNRLKRLLPVRRSSYVPQVVTLPLPHRLSAWLCLVLIFLTGLGPAQGFIVCIEQDGCVSFEVKSTDTPCGGCGAHEERTPPVQATTARSDDAACPCIDLALPSSPEQQFSQSRSLGVYVGPWIAPSPEIRFQHATPAVTAGRGPPRCILRVADSWAHIRTVVLLV